jgi:hypothetical protein
MPQLNPDGTVQVAPPTQSAFAPQPMQPAPPPQQMAPQVSNGTPGISGAILDAIKALIPHLAPHAVTDIKARNAQNESKALGDQY